MKLCEHSERKDEKNAPRLEEGYIQHLQLSLEDAVGEKSEEEYGNDEESGQKHRNGRVDWRKVPGGSDEGKRVEEDGEEIEPKVNSVEFGA